MKKLFALIILIILSPGCQKADLGPLDLRKNLLSALQFYRPTLPATLITEGWTVSTLAGGTTGDTDGVGTTVKLKPFRASGVIQSDAYYFSDYINFKIKKLNLLSNSVSTFVSTGTANPSGLVYQNNKLLYVTRNEFITVDSTGTKTSIGTSPLSSTIIPYDLGSAATMAFFPMNENPTFNIWVAATDPKNYCGAIFGQKGTSTIPSSSSTDFNYFVDIPCSTPADGTISIGGSVSTAPKTGNLVSIIPSNYTTKPKYFYACGTNMVMQFLLNISAGSGTIIAGNINGTTTANGKGKEAVFESMGGCALSGKDLYIGQSGSIRRFDLVTKEVTTLAGNLPSQLTTVTSVKDGSGNDATICNASALTVYNNSLVFIDTCVSGSTTTYAAIRKITPPSGKSVLNSALNEEASSFTNKMSYSCNSTGQFHCYEDYAATLTTENGSCLSNSAAYTKSTSACSTGTAVGTCTCRITATNDIIAKVIYYPPLTLASLNTYCTNRNSTYTTAGIGITCQ